MHARTRTSAGHVAVIGAGVFGSWTARALMGAGYRVTLIDAHGPANMLASSGGESRMTRAGYGRDRIYSRMAIESLADWKALSERALLPIFHPHGVLFFAAGEPDYFRDILDAHAELGRPTEALGRAEMAKRFPMIDFDGVDTGVFEPGFGALMARRGVQTLVAEMIASGLDYRRGKAMPLCAFDGAVEAIALSDGTRVEADSFVVAAGPWLPKLFPTLLGGRITPTRQEVFFFAAPDGDRRFGPAHLPGWADFNGGDLYYGFPDLEERGVKFAHDRHGEPVDPDSQSRRPSKEALADIIAFRDRRFPALKGARLVDARVCQYENSSNGDFLIDRHPAHPNLILVGGGSGHGFKHGPAVGRIAADLVAGKPQSEARFSLATKEKAQKRSVI
ncbi:glycine/D-amino acid oxidase-like deaminating enzyme [Sphingomicrobium lutaoense]|uniref:Glycine/D-amino acid oxidase-like deaminating enzyme n=1 Tax=Sphingomicrobium lutaoense TaxID=515949 RepID=A0A839Z306_9SPHN|nr:FAD-dependent oxidoreductase [Sphingomicrobium lutaoense]MBB3764002.1 glycine/D-amino acid oxidase-like deaminating enzyme [Sphingomicrobium lutaoense]